MYSFIDIYFLHKHILLIENLIIVRIFFYHMFLTYNSFYLLDISILLKTHNKFLNSNNFYQLTFKDICSASKYNIREVLKNNGLT